MYKNPRKIEPIRLDFPGDFLSDIITTKTRVSLYKRYACFLYTNKICLLISVVRPISAAFSVHCRNRKRRIIAYVVAELCGKDFAYVCRRRKSLFFYDFLRAAAQQAFAALKNATDNNCLRIKNINDYRKSHSQPFRTYIKNTESVRCAGICTVRNFLCRNFIRFGWICAVRNRNSLMKRFFCIHSAKLCKSSAGAKAFK